MGTAMLWIEAFVQEWNARKKAAALRLVCDPMIYSVLGDGMV
jgi:hypothetical protein